MKSLTEAEIATLERFGEELSKPGMPVRIEYAPPPSPYVTVHFKKPGRGDQRRDLVLSGHSTFEQLKGVIKKAAGVV